MNARSDPRVAQPVPVVFPGRPDTSAHRKSTVFGGRDDEPPSAARSALNLGGAPLKASSARQVETRGAARTVSELRRRELIEGSR
jgi:hypothetical protein